MATYVVHFYTFMSRRKASLETERLFKQAGIDTAKAKPTVIFSPRRPKGARIVAKSDLGELYLLSDQEPSLGDLLTQALKK